MVSRLIKYISIFIISSLFLSQSVFALDMIFEAFIVQSTNKIEFMGSEPGGQFGAELKKGDFNGDGLDDLVVGAPFASTGMLEWNGGVFVIFGRNIDATIPVSTNLNSYDITFFGEHSGDQLGTALEVGDFDGDGLDDLAIGAHNAYIGGDRLGKVYILYGKTLLSKHFSSLSISDADLVLKGEYDSGNFGIALHSTNINRDDYDDLFIGAPNEKIDNGKETGAAYVLLGSYRGLSGIDIEFHGHEAGERFGSIIRSGDIDRDGLIDIIIGAYKATADSFNEAGKLYLYKGSKNYPIIVNNPRFIFEGSGDKEWFGFALEIGDINGDRYDDIAVSNFPYGLGSNTGEVYVVYGGKWFSGEGEMFTAKDRKDFVIRDSIGENFLGASILMDDFDNDGKDDIAVGAPGIGNPISVEEGDVYILHSDDMGRKSYSVVSRDITSIVHGENADDWFGYRIEGLDFNGDGFEDLAIGSRYSDTNNSFNNGKVFLLFGHGGKFGTMRSIQDPNVSYVTRGELVSIVIDSFDIKNSKREVIDDCYEHLDFCLFNFMAMSSYDDIKLMPQIILYPDVSPFSAYYEDITIATILGLLNGHTSEKNTPFHPELPITRIQAMKVIFGATDLVNPLHRFELVSMLGSYRDLVTQSSYFKDVDPQISHMWWYPRYVNFAVENGIVNNDEYFRPDDNITFEELMELINNTAKYIEGT